MDRNALIVLLVTIGVIVIVNFVMFGVVRGILKGDNRWLRSLTDTLMKPTEKSNAPYDELRRRMQDLSGEEKGPEKDRE